MIRRYRPDDEPAVLALADRLTVGVAPWRDAAAVRSAVRGWAEGAVASAGTEPVWVWRQSGIRRQAYESCLLRCPGPERVPGLIPAPR